jgi:hypothetical protein
MSRQVIPPTPEEAAAFERKCRDLLEAEFRANNSHFSEGDRAHRVDFSEIRLEGSYPDTRVVVEGRTRWGSPFLDKWEIWGPDSQFQTGLGLESSVGDILITYLESQASSVPPEGERNTE